MEPFSPKAVMEMTTRMITELRKKHHLQDEGAPAPFRSTCGLVIDGVSVSLVVPGTFHKLNCSSVTLNLFQVWGSACIL